MTGHAISPRAQAVYDRLRALIGTLPSGAALPSVARIRAKTGSGQSTVEKAMELLQTQGLIERRRRRGVYVADLARRVGEIAIVLDRAVLEHDASPIYGTTCSRLGAGLKELNPQWQVNLHLGSIEIAAPA
ncbi:MAG: winged helix-turn-helix domain-containing protein, partial [Kiritimatiellae bacterium]|nr:winged helix-turn-helix domain-containing protein [Kiritimatiellia bacterium]